MKRILIKLKSILISFKTSFKERLFEINALIIIILVNITLLICFNYDDILRMIFKILGMLLSYVFLPVILYLVLEIYVSQFEKLYLKGKENSNYYKKDIDQIRTRLLLAMLCLILLIDTIGILKFKFSILNVLQDFLHNTENSDNA